MEESCSAASGNMSHIGNKTITVPAGVTVTVDPQWITVKGVKGELKEPMQSGISVEVADGQVKVARQNESKEIKSKHGLVRSLINNMIEGVTKGYEIKLEMVGTGYRVMQQGSKLVLSVGFSHPVDVVQPQGITFTVDGNNKIVVKGISKYLVGQTAANIRRIKPPEPYKGKGIRYEGEAVRRKAGKAVKAAA